MLASAIFRVSSSQAQVVELGRYVKRKNTSSTARRTSYIFFQSLQFAGQANENIPVTTNPGECNIPFTGDPGKFYFSFEKLISHFILRFPDSEGPRIP